MCKLLSLPQKWVLKGIPVLFLIGSFMHFLYDLSGENVIAGMVAAVNESVWEHTKMVLLPVIFWWTVYYLIKGKENNIDKNKWFTGSLAALLTALATIPLIYYFYTGAFGVEILAVDIIILFISVLFGQISGLHFYKYCKGINSFIVIFIFIVIIAIYIIFTFYPPHLPVFIDGIIGKYGMNL